MGVISPADEGLLIVVLIAFVVGIYGTPFFYEPIPLLKINLIMIMRAILLVLIIGNSVISLHNKSLQNRSPIFAKKHDFNFRSHESLLFLCIFFKITCRCRSRSFPDLHFQFSECQNHGEINSTR